GGGKSALRFYSETLSSVHAFADGGSRIHFREHDSRDAKGRGRGAGRLRRARLRRTAGRRAGAIPDFVQVHAGKPGARGEGGRAFSCVSAGDRNPARELEQTRNPRMARVAGGGRVQY